MIKKSEILIRIVNLEEALDQCEDKLKNLDKKIKKLDKIVTPPKTTKKE